MALDLDTLLDKASESFTAGRSYGPVVEQDGCTVIPAAFVVSVGGGGGGASPPEAANAGSGGGGGFVAVSWPVGAYVVRDGDVRWISALDSTRLAVAAIGLVGVLLKVRARRASVGGGTD
jgi:uncharacterized spore protein YtfJ